MSQKKWIGFPDKFLWGVGSSAHQIEGYNSNSDWWLYEEQPGKIKKGEKSGAACDHWNRVEEDTQLLKDAGAQVYRFGVEWAKIQPTEDSWDESVILHYKNELDLLLKAGIIPMITLQHFSIPLWLAHQGGWAAEGAPEKFLKFSKRIYEELGSKVEYWITINEPMVVLVLGYLSGHGPPGSGGLGMMIEAMDGMIRGHALVYHECKKMSKELGWINPQIGIAHHLRVFQPKRKWNLLDWITAHGISRAFNWSFFDAVETGNLFFKVPRHVNVKRQLANAKGTQDFIGINYYSRDHVQFGFKHPFWFHVSFRQDRPLTDLGWEIYPRGIYKLIKQSSKRATPGKPIWITENGVADRYDSKRESFIKQHLFWLSRAIKKGLPVVGYIHWTIYDNFEWSEGYDPKFGLYENDFKTQVRTPRKSAITFKQIIQDNGFELDDNKLAAILGVKQPSLKSPTE
ncbi:MAG: glycoside hydrolase family 1 protein [Xanthomonadaceae bacterium]|nr:glycoside hydrolase family 1 protein [Xanthomonadaceae bacterium]